MGLPTDSGIKLINKYEKGQKNLITDVTGVKVGHVTLSDSAKGIHTGVTAILPHDDNIFRNKVMAGAEVINGFGKSVGLVQLAELGTIETPIMMTNTFGVGAVLNGLTKYMLEQNSDIGDTTGTVNCVVTECNDWMLNDIRGLHVKEQDAINAIHNAGDIFEEGAVGAGTGMRCMGHKGGIGSASRILEIDDKKYTLGCIVMSNFGLKGDLRINGELIDAESVKDKETEKGSIVIVIASDIPLSDRQLRRTAKRAASGLARTGSYYANGSGDIAIAFSTGNIVPHYSEKKILDTKMFHDDAIDIVFEASAEVVEESIISSLWHADTTKGFKNHVAHGIRECL